MSMTAWLDMVDELLVPHSTQLCSIKLQSFSFIIKHKEQSKAPHALPSPHPSFQHPHPKGLFTWEQIFFSTVID